MTGGGSPEPAPLAAETPTPLSVEDAIRSVASRYDGEDDEAARLAESAIRRLSWRTRRGGKECSRCGATKTVSAFGPDGRNSDGLQGVCRSCDSARKR